MITNSDNYIDRLLEYVSVLSTTFKNRYAAHTDWSEQLSYFIDEYCDLLRARMDGIQYEELQIDLTGRLAEYLGVDSFRYTEDFGSELWRLFLIWVRDLLNLGANYDRSVNLFKDLFGADIVIDDNSDFYKFLTEDLDGNNPLILDLTMEVNASDSRYNTNNFVSIFGKYKDILPVYLVHNLNFNYVVDDYVFIDEEWDYEIDVYATDKQTADFLITGSLDLIVWNNLGILKVTTIDQDPQLMVQRSQAVPTEPNTHEVFEILCFEYRNTTGTYSGSNIPKSYLLKSSGEVDLTNQAMLDIEKGSTYYFPYDIYDLSHDVDWSSINGDSNDVYICGNIIIDLDGASDLGEGIGYWYIEDDFVVS